MEKSQRFDQYFQKLIQLVQNEKAAEKEEQIAILNQSDAFSENLNHRCLKVLLYEKDDDASVCVFQDLRGDLKHRDVRDQFSKGNRVILKQFTHSDAQVCEEGLIIQVDTPLITVQFSANLPKSIRDGKWYLHLLSNEITWRRSLEFMESWQTTHDFEKIILASTLLGEMPFKKNTLQEIVFSDARLNTAQKEILNEVLSAQHVGLIFGPPGTGKTRTLAECIDQLIKRHETVLVCAPSNSALDHLLKLVIEKNIPFVRLGPEHKIENEISNFHINTLKQETFYFDEIKRLKKERMVLMEHIKKKKSRNYIPSAEYKSYKQSLADLKREITQLEKLNLEKVLKSVPLIACTHAGFPSDYKNLLQFDTVVIDEASQSLPFLTWISVYMAKKIILAGDPFQLPPVLKSVSNIQHNKNMKPSLHEHIETTLLQHLISFYPYPCMLKDQYRMTPLIEEWPNIAFYHNALKCQVIKDKIFRKQCASLFEKDVVFIDSAGSDMVEMNEEGGSSLYNQGEAKLMRYFVDSFLDVGCNPRQIGCITPYTAQVRLINDLVRNENVEINSIDAFQGREKDIVLISMVRSNFINEAGFLVDFRRFNVAVTRAKKQLVIIGNSATLSHVPFLREWLNWIDTHGETRSVWEWSEVWMN